MKLLDKLGLTESQQKIIVKVTALSTLGCFLFVGGMWAGRSLAIFQHSIKSKPAVLQAPALEGIYREKSECLLPVDIEAHKFCAEYFLKNERPEAAIPHLIRVQMLDKNNRRLRLDLANAYLRSGQYPYALREYINLTEEEIEDSLSPSIAAQHGLALFYMRRIDESIARLNGCLAQDKHNAEAACYLGQVKASLTIPSPEAEEYFQKAIDWKPDFIEAWYQFGKYYMDTRQYEKSRAYYRHIIETEPINAKAHARLGMAYYYLDKKELARKSYETALAINPQDYNTHYNLGELLFSEFEDHKGALEEFTKTLAIIPDHSQANFKTGLICLENNMAKEAARYLEKARTGEPDNIRILLQLGVAYEKLAMRAEALQTYQAILAIDELNHVALQKVQGLSQNAAE